MNSTKRRGLSEAQKLAKRIKYAEIKSNPELYNIERQKEREKYKKKKLKKQVISVNEMSPREQRLQRKKWREAARKYRQKKKEELKEIPLPETVQIECKGGQDEEIKKENDPLPPTESPTTKIRRIRYLELKKRKRLLDIISDLKKKNAMLKRENAKLRNNMDKGNEMISRVNVTAINNEKRTKIYSMKQDQRTNRKLINLVRNFYINDSNSTIVAGKKEYVTRNKIPMQKRCLNNSLKALYKKFLTQHNIRVSYGFFCKYRPYWVVFPKNNMRDTCACIIHSNIELIIECLNKNGLIKERNSQELLASLCCSQYSETCLKRNCQNCKSKTLTYNEFSNDHQLSYYQWVRQRERVIKKKGSRIQIITIKKEINDLPLNIIQELDKKMSDFFWHCYKIQTQYNNITQLKKNLGVNEALIHVDYSENYGLKYGTEVQSMHFGGSRKEICLHTAVIYTFDFHFSGIGETCAATASKCLRHDAPAVWAHITPLIRMALENNPFIDKIHFVSDSPISQYRNKYIFGMICNLWKDFPQIADITWNYTEAGHGKGAPDGVGAVLKRTADNLVKFGQDIATFEQFVDAMQQNIENVLLFTVDEKDVTERAEAILKLNMKPFAGTLSVHQVLWNKNSNQLTFRKVSCFTCGAGTICTHGKHLGYLKITQSTVSEPQDNSDYVATLESTRRLTPQVRVLTNITNVQPIADTIPSVVVTGKASDIILSKKVFHKPDLSN